VAPHPSELETHLVGSAGIEITGDAVTYHVIPKRIVFSRAIWSIRSQIFSDDCVEQFHDTFLVKNTAPLVTGAVVRDGAVGQIELPTRIYTAPFICCGIPADGAVI